MLIDIPSEELQRLQKREIEAALADNRIELVDAKKVANVMHLENA